MTNSFTMTRRGALKLGLGATAAAALTATGCGKKSESGAGGGATTLRFTWWGNDARTAATTKVIEAFKTEAPTITVKPENGEWSSYWDKLATQVAANDAPDIIQMDEKYIREYGGRGALLDLSKYGLDTSKFIEGTVDPGKTDDGLVGINAGVNAPVILANQTVFKKAGIELPDDKTWTWESFQKLASELTAKLPSGSFGAGATNDASFGVWLRQRGKGLFTADGLGYEPADLAEWFDFNLALVESKSTPGAELQTEEATKALDQSALAVGKLAMGMVWSNQISAFDNASGEDLKILRYPSSTGKTADVKLWYKASMFWSASSRTKNPEDAVKFINFLCNSLTAGEAMLTERGVPANADVRAGIAGKLNASDKKVVAFLDEIKPELGEAPNLPPIGGGKMADIVTRYMQEVLFKRMPSMDAANKCIEEVKNDIAAAS